MSDRRRKFRTKVETDEVVNAALEAFLAAEIVEARRRIGAAEPDGARGR